MFHRPIPSSTQALFVVAMLDLATSLVWVKMGHGEGNPLFAWLLNYGQFAFVFGKLALLALPIVALEYSRQRKPLTAELGTWAAVVLYVVLYVLHLARF